MPDNKYGSPATDELAAALERCEGYFDLRMFDAAWEELENLPTELKVELVVLSWRMQILVELGEHQKASCLGLRLVEQFPQKLGICLFTVTCLFETKQYREARAMLRNALPSFLEDPDIWLSLARAEAHLGNEGAVRNCVKRYVSLYPEGKAALIDKPEFDFLWT